MLPTGHIAAGFLTSAVLIKIFKPDLDVAQIRELYIAGAFWGFAPDLDEFIFFIKNRSWLVSPEGKKENNHRYFFTHAPILWMVAGIIFNLLANNVYWKFFGLLIWLGSWSHFILDSIEYGVMWLWPKRVLYSFFKAEEEKAITEKRFLNHNVQFLKDYFRRASFYFEIAIICVAIFIVFSI